MDLHAVLADPENIIFYRHPSRVPVVDHSSHVTDKRTTVHTSFQNSRTVLLLFIFCFIGGVAGGGGGMPPMSGGGGGIPPASSSSGGGGIPHSSGGGGIPVIGAAIGFGENTLLSSSCVMSVKSKPSISSLFWSTAVVEVVKCDAAKIGVNLETI